ncbi:hypothetical protein, partial [Mariniphaga sediminis]|uniref:hypothetical protein n=1 Tax=Mariniphaga sediminis TaxID=1628158 RepID=UPI00356985D8
GYRHLFFKVSIKVVTKYFPLPVSTTSVFIVLFPDSQQKAKKHFTSPSHLTSHVTNRSSALHEKRED